MSTHPGQGKTEAPHHFPDFEWCDASEERRYNAGVLQNVGHDVQQLGNDAVAVVVAVVTVAVVAVVAAGAGDAGCAERGGRGDRNDGDDLLGASHSVSFAVQR